MRIREPSKCLLIMAALLFMASPSPAENARELSDKATVSLLTQWPGYEIYYAFGHSALRIRDPQRGMDLVFNYGTFDLEDPLFIPKFVKGDLNYFLSYYPYDAYLQYDKRTQNRIWYEQVLNLDAGQAAALLAFLLDNARPEKKYYRYDFIMDNCSTRIRDALIRVFGTDVRIDPGNTMAQHKSFRRMIDEFVADRPLFQFLFYPFMGMASDREVTSFESQFLPFYLMNAFQASTIVRNGKEEPLVLSSAEVYTPEIFVNRGSPLSNPAFVLWPLSAVILLFTAINVIRLRKNRTPPARRLPWRILDALFFFLIGFMGCLVYYLTFFSVHAAMKGNLNALWILPTHLAAAWFCLRKKSAPRFMSWYFLAAAALPLLPLIAWPVWPQGMHPTMIPLMLAVSARCFRHFLAARRTA